MLGHLSQAHDTTYISCHPYVFYKKMFLNNSQNSQENNCAGVSNSCNFNKKEALAQEVSRFSSVDAKNLILGHIRFTEKQA